MSSSLCVLIHLCEVLQFVASHPALQRLRGTPSALIKLASDLAHLTLPEARGREAQSKSEWKLLEG